MGLFNKKNSEIERKEQEKRARQRKIFNVSIVAVVVLLFLFLFNLVFKNTISNIKTAAMVVLIPLAIAWFLSYIAAPIEKKINKIIKKRVISTVLSIIIVLLVLAGILTLCVVLLYSQISDLLITHWDKVQDLISELFPDNSDNIINLLKDLLLTADGKVEFDKVLILGTEVFGVVGTIVDWLIYIAMCPIFMFFLIVDKHRIFEGILTVVPEKYRVHVAECGKLADTTTTNYIRGRVIAMLFVGLSFGVAYGIVFGIMGKVNPDLGIMTGICYGILFGIILGVLDIVPYLGPFLGVVLPMGFSLIVANTIETGLIWAAIILGINFIIQFIENNIFIPKVMEKETEVNALLVLCSILFFGSLFGAVGMILAVPIVGTIQGCAAYFKTLDKPIFGGDSTTILTSEIDSIKNMMEKEDE